MEGSQIQLPVFSQCPLTRNSETGFVLCSTLGNRDRGWHRVGTQ